MHPPSTEIGPNDPKGQSTWQHSIGVAFLGGGISLAVCRFALLPFGQGTSTISVVIGLATGLFVAGLFQMRAATPKSPIGTMVLAFLVGGAMTAGGFFAIYPPPPALAELGLARHSLPGLDALLPEQEPSQRDVDAGSGMIKYERPADLSGAISLEWQPGDAWQQEDVDLVARTLRETLDPAASVRTTKLSVAGQAAFGIVFSNDRMEMRGALWSCPDDGRAFTLWCGFAADADKVQALFDRLVAGLACTSPPEQAQGQAPALASLPAIGTPGFGLMETSGYVQLGNLDGEILLVQHKRSGNLSKLLTDKPDLLKQVLAGLAQQDGMRLDFDPTARRFTARDGQRRPLWLIEAAAEGEKFFMAVSVVDCEASRSFLLMYMRSAEAASDHETKAKTLLATIACPGPVVETPPRFEDMAREACDAGEARGCFQLADLYQVADEADPRVSPLLKKACGLGLPQACPEEGP